MTSKLVVNTIEADTGISSVSFASSISMSSTSKFHFSAAGIDIDADTNINRPAAGVLGFNINGAEKLRIDTNGHLNTSGIVTAANFKSGVTNVHNLGLTLTGGQLDVGSNIKIGTAGVITATSFVGSGAQLTGITSPAITSIGSDGTARVLTSDGDGTATAHSEVKIETVSGNKRLSINRGTGSTEVPLLVRRTDASGIVAEFSNSSGYGVYIGQNGATGEGYIRTATGQPLVFTTNAGSGITNERLRIPSDGGIELKTDGKGIQFPTPQTPYHANSNRVGISSEMRYYETGTVTPGLSSTVLNGLQIATFTDGSYARRVNRYVRVGHLVFCTIEIKMAGSVTYNGGNTSTTPVCITGTCPFKWAYSNRYDVSGEPDFIPCSISYDSSGLSNDTVYAVLTRNYNAQPRIDITRVGSGGSRQFNSVNFGMVFPANASIAVSYCYPIDLDNADY